MADQADLDALKAKYQIEQVDKPSGERYQTTRHKTSQDTNVVCNALTFEDTSNDNKFIVAVNISVNKKLPKGVSAPKVPVDLAPEELKKLQSLVSEFLNELHTKL